MCGLFPDAVANTLWYAVAYDTSELMLIGVDVPYSVACGLRTPPLKLELTMLLMNGASVLLKIGCGAEVSEAGCVQLWFSIAMTKTDFTDSAPAAQQ